MNWINQVFKSRVNKQKAWHCFKQYFLLNFLEDKSVRMSVEQCKFFTLGITDFYTIELFSFLSREEKEFEILNYLFHRKATTK